jgi:opine dehydrogenase
MFYPGELQIAVIGAGHGGKSMAADLASRGYAVRLYNRSYEHIEAIAQRGGIEVTLEDGRQEFGQLRLVTSDIAAALEGADLVMVVIPASGHRDVALACAPHLRDGQCLVLNPGRTGGALEFRQVLRETGCTADVVIAEAETFLFTSRSNGPAEAHIFRRKNTLPLAALPSTRTHEVLDILQEVYPQFIAAPNVLYTSLNNMGAVFHPALTLLNAGWIEASGGDFEFYIDGPVGPGVAGPRLFGLRR